MMLAKITEDIKNALREKQTERLSLLRMLRAAMQTRQIEQRAQTGNMAPELTDAEIISVFKQEAKKRQDAMRQFAVAGRNELVAKEQVELELIQSYLPPELAEDELESIVKNVFELVMPAVGKDFGKIMGAVMKEVAGRASGERVAILIKKFLSG